MKGTMIDFLNLIEREPGLAREIGKLAAEYDFEFVSGDELSDGELDAVVGGGWPSSTVKKINKAAKAIIDNI